MRILFKLGIINYYIILTVGIIHIAIFIENLMKYILLYI